MYSESLCMKRYQVQTSKILRRLIPLEEGYIEQGCDIIYKDKDTIMIGIFDPEVGYGYNIHNFDNSKTTLEIIVAIGSQDELSEKRFI